MVYYDTFRKINDLPWATHFSLTTFYMKTRKTKDGNYMDDIEIGDMLLNLKIHEYMIKCFGVDVTHMRSSYPALTE